MPSDKNLKLYLDYEADNLSALPDHLLVDILSLIPLKKAAQTSVLSRRWRCLWKFVHTIHLKEDMTFKEADALRCANFYEEIERYTDVNFWGNVAKFYEKFVSDLLVSKLKVLKINFAFGYLHHQAIDNLISFGVERGVEELYLVLILAHGDPQRYKIPESVFSVSSLKKLELTSCELGLPASIHLPRLKILQISDCSFEITTLQTLVSNCRALENLHLFGCNFWGHLVLDGMNMVFKTLKIRNSDKDCPNKKIKIANPRLEVLEIGGAATLGMYSTENLVSLQTVCLRLIDDEEFDSSWDILNGLHHVNSLEIHLQRCRWRIGHQRKTCRPRQPLNTTHLKLVTSFEKPEHLRSICQLLSSFAHLESLQIVVDFVEDIYFDEEVDCWEHLQHGFWFLLSQLRTVTIYIRIVTEYYNVWHYDCPEPGKQLNQLLGTLKVK